MRVRRPNPGIKNIITSGNEDTLEEPPLALMSSALSTVVAADCID